MDVGRLDRNRMLTALAATAFTLSLIACTWLLLSPPSSTGGLRVRPSGVAVPASDPAAAAPLVTILSPGAVQTDVQVLGVLSAQQDALALLSIDGGAPQAFSSGQRLGPSTVLARITVDAIELEQAGQRRTLAAPMLPPLADSTMVSAGDIGTR